MFEYNLKNSNEELVSDLTKEIMAETDMCRCEKCRLDIMALALNQLQPSYVVTFKGGLLATLNSTHIQAQADAMAAVLRATDMVRASPQHD